MTFPKRSFSWSRSELPWSIERDGGGWAVGPRSLWQSRRRGSWASNSRRFQSSKMFHGFFEDFFGGSKKWFAIVVTPRYFLEKPCRCCFLRYFVNFATGKLDVLAAPVSSCSPREIAATKLPTSKVSTGETKQQATDLPVKLSKLLTSSPKSHEVSTCNFAHQLFFRGDIDALKSGSSALKTAAGHMESIDVTEGIPCHNWTTLTSIFMLCSEDIWLQQWQP